MTADEVTEDLIAPTTGTRHPSTTPRAARRVGRLRQAVTAAMAAGVMILAVPAASAAESVAGPSQRVIAASPLSATLPSTITLTTRRTGSVIL